MIENCKERIKVSGLSHNAMFITFEHIGKLNMSMI